MNNMRIVIADNQPEDLKVINNMLGKAGHNVLAEAQDGVSALKLIRNYEPELVILGAALPGMDGLEVAGIMAQEIIAPVIMVSSFYSQEMIERAKDAMVMAFLVKPLEETNIINAIKIARVNYEKVKELQLEVSKLTDALENRKTLEKAKGLLMTKQGITEEEAFKKIQKQSMEKRKSMKEIAESIIIAYEL